jgi:hypothetical protein
MEIPRVSRSGGRDGQDATPEEIRRMSPEQRERSLAEFVDFLREQAGPPVEVPVPRTFALAIDYEDVPANAHLQAGDLVAVGVECDSDALVRVRNPYTRRVDNFVFDSAENARHELSELGGPLSLIWGEPLLPTPN